MLEGRYVEKRILHAYQTCDPFPSLIQVSLGINRTFPEAPHALILLLDRTLIVDDKTRHHRLEATVFGAGSALCPEGKTAMIVRLTSRWDYWTSLQDKDPGRYQAEKASILQEIIGLLDKRFPGLAQNLEATDIATPATFVRYTSNWQGSYEGWLPTPRILGRWLPFVLPGLKEFYMAGHWVVPGGGLPSAALSGRYVAQLICARSRRPFTATEP
jgi:phytoene dehydrogenase-like protein